MWYINTKWANAVENGADSLAQCRDGTKVQFVKKIAIFVKHNKVKLHKPQRYACLLSRKKKQENKRLYMVWFLLCDMSRKANLWRQQMNILVTPGFGRGGGSFEG